MQFETFPAPSLSLDQYPNLVTLFDEAIERFADQTAFENFGVKLSYRELSKKADAFAGFLASQGIVEGDRFAVMVPNCLQYPVAALACLRAGIVLVNVNPLYTPRELVHQLNDSGAKGILVLANMAVTVQEALPEVNLKTIVVSELADMMPQPKRLLMNFVVKHVKKMVPAFELGQATTFLTAVQSTQGFTKTTATHDSIVALQYTGGTTGVSKGAVLTHRNLMANMMQIDKLFDGKVLPGMIAYAPLPLYHVFSFVGHMMWLFKCGVHSVLITNPRDLPAFVKTMKKTPPDIFIGLNTLFIGLIKRDDFAEVDFSKLFLTVSGGMALTSAAATEWKRVTGCDICEGYGLTETSPVLSVNPLEGIRIGSIGLPLADTEMVVVDEAGDVLPVGSVGEIAAKGPQVMQGYWNRPEATAESMTPAGHFKTGDMGIQQDDGYFKIVDRKKDMILVSGFNVYPNEVEDVLTSHPDIIEAAVVGVPDEAQGESVKAFVVVENQVPVEQLTEWCRERLTAYKVPRAFEFRDELPKTNVGKVLRRALRN